MMTLPEIDSFVPRRFLPAAQVFSLSRKDRQISSQTSRQLGHEHARQSNERCVCVTRSIQPENITPAIGSRLEKKSILSEQKKNKAVFTVQILSTACRVYQPNALPKRIVCLEGGGGMAGT